MECEIKGKPAFAYLDISLAPGESIVAESDAMATMDANLQMSAGFFSALLRVKALFWYKKNE